jgi:DNA-binding response OmpR family regulator
LVAANTNRQRQLVDARVIGFAFDGNDWLNELTQQLERCGVSVDRATTAVLVSHPTLAVYVVGFDEAALSQAHTVVQWSRASDLPPGLIAVIVHGGPAEREQALLAGFDDAVTLPVSPRELSGRVRAVQRRLEWTAGTTRVGFGPLTLDLHERIAWFDTGERHQLTANECEVLHALILAQGRVLTYGEVFRTAWKREGVRKAARDVQATVKRIRQKLGRMDTIETVHDIGLRLAPS